MRYLVPMTAAACLLAGASGAARAADCHIDPYSFHFGTDTSTQMTVRSGKSCGSTIEFHGGGASGMTVSQEASNGAVTIPNTSRWQYVSRRGFTGPDQFVVDVSGEAMGRLVFRGTTHIAVSVNVTP